MKQIKCSTTTSVSKLLLMVVALMTRLAAAGAISGVLTVEDPKVSTPTRYTFELEIASKIPAGGYLTMLLDADYGLPAGQAVSCTGDYGFAQFGTCRVDADGRTVLVEGLESQDFLLIVTLSGLPTPGYVSLWAVFVQSWQGSGLPIDNSGINSFTFRTTPGDLSCTLQNLGSDVVAEYTNISVLCIVSNEVEATGSFTMGLPKWNAGTPEVGLERSMIEYDVLQAAAGPDGLTYPVPCTSVEHPGITCTISPAEVSTVEQISTSRDTLRITGLTRAILSGQAFNFRTTSEVVRNPPTTKEISTFEATTYRGDGKEIDNQKAGIKYQVNTPITIPSDRVQIRAPTGEINQQQVFDFTILNMPIPLPVGAVIELKIPREVSIFADDARQQKILTGATGYQPLFTSPQIQIISEDQQIVHVKYLVPSQNNYVNEGNPFKFGLLQLKNPGSIQETPEFEINIYQEDKQILRVDPTGLTYKASPGILENVRIIPENYKTRQAVPYDFSFETKNALFQNGDIAILVPSEIEVTPANLKYTPLATVSLTNTVTLSWDEATRTIHINNAFAEAIPAPTQVRFRIDAGLRNSYSTDPITPITVQTLDVDGEVIDEGASEAIEFTANEINQILATACADKPTASTTEEVCTYRLKFMIGAQFPILSGSLIEIELPDDLSIPDPAVTRDKSQSYTDGVADLTSEFQVSTNKRVVWVGGAFVQASAPNGVDWRQDSFSVYIAGILTPRSTAPTLSFKAKIKTSKNFIQYKKEQGVYSAVYQAKNFQNVGITRTSAANGDSSGMYLFTIVLSTTVKINEYVKIEPPASITVTPDADQCQGIQELAPLLSCTISNRSIYVRLMPENADTREWAAGTTIKFSIGSMTNPLSFELTESFKIYVATNVQNDYYVQQILEGLTITNTEAGQLLNAQLLPDSN